MFKLGIHHTILLYHLMILLAFVVVFSGVYWLTVLPMGAAATAVLGYRPQWAAKEKGRVVQLAGTSEKIGHKAA